MEKRLMFLHQILSCGENRLINQFLWAQEKKPVKNDWILQAKEDLKSFELDYLTLKNIQHMKKEQFKALVKMKCKQIAFKALLAEKESKSKLTSIQYSVLKIQDYLLSSQMNLRRKKLVFKIRTRMVATSDNYGQKVSCKLCHLEGDTISHILNCILLKVKVPEILTHRDISISDAYKDDMTRLSMLASVFEKAWRTREDILN